MLYQIELHRKRLNLKEPLHCTQLVVGLRIDREYSQYSFSPFKVDLLLCSAQCTIAQLSHFKYALDLPFFFSSAPFEWRMCSTNVCFASIFFSSFIHSLFIDSIPITIRFLITDTVTCIYCRIKPHRCGCYGLLFSLLASFSPIK